MWCPVLIFSASYLLLDAVAAFIISRLIYLGVRNFLEQLCDCFGARLQARLASRPAASHASLLLLGSTTWPSGAPIVPSMQWNGGGIGGTNLPDSGVAQSRVLRPFLNRLQTLERVPSATNYSTRGGGAGTVGSGTSLLTAAQRRDWIAVTDPQRRIEVPVYPGISSLVNVLTYEALDTRIGHRLKRFARWTTALLGATDTYGNPNASAAPTISTTSDKTLPTSLTSSGKRYSTSLNTTTMTDVSVFHQLPEELISYILLLAACPSLSTHEPRSCPTNIVSLSRRYYNLIIPRLYHSVSLHTPAAFRSFRVTLALHNPGMGKFVRKLQIGSSGFDASGYCPSALADHAPLSVGIEQMLLASPNLQELSLDLFSMNALHTGTVSRLEKGPQPTRLCTELTTIPYLSLPTFEDLRELELLVFGMDAATASELRATLPLLEKLELRLVTRRRGPAFQTQDTWSPAQLPTFDDTGEDDESSAEERAAEADIQRGSDDGDVFQLESDMQDFIDALHLLRTWPGGDVQLGKSLKVITVFAWPNAVRRLKKVFGDAQYGGEKEATPIRVELDRGYLLGPRRGAHVLWRKDRARAAWAT
ncbi:uncharacterized protein SPSC_02329 [Sporisorium scitamineum]|nr:uncharacterized protein SPSC_02329 [Sporisorium scitamineum]